MAETGQLKKVRFWRVERDLRAVKERELSSEQLESWRERRWLKGLEESHWKREQGFFEGKLRAWRALTCLGSRVDGEVDTVGVLGGSVDGEEVGEGLGGRLFTPAAAAAVERRRRRRGERMDECGGLIAKVK